MLGGQGNQRGKTQRAHHWCEAWVHRQELTYLLVRRLPAALQRCTPPALCQSATPPPRHWQRQTQGMMPAVGQIGPSAT